MISAARAVAVAKLTVVRIPGKRRSAPTSSSKRDGGATAFGRRERVGRRPRTFAFAKTVAHQKRIGEARRGLEILSQRRRMLTVTDV
jgi:hypothetical protein